MYQSYLPTGSTQSRASCDGIAYVELIVWSKAVC